MPTSFQCSVMTQDLMDHRQYVRRTLAIIRGWIPAHTRMPIDAVSAVLTLQTFVITLSIQSFTIYTLLPCKAISTYLYVSLLACIIAVISIHETRDTRPETRETSCCLIQRSCIVETRRKRRMFRVPTARARKLIQQPTETQTCIYPQAQILFYSSILIIHLV